MSNKHKEIYNTTKQHLAELITILRKSETYILPEQINKSIEHIIQTVPTVVVIGDLSAGKSSLLRRITGLNAFQIKAGLGTKYVTIVHMGKHILKNSVILCGKDGSKIEVQEYDEDKMDAFYAKIDKRIMTVTQDYFLHIYVKSDNHIDIIDLPGIRVDNFSIIDTCKRYINNNNCILLHVIKSDSDTATVSSNRIMKEMIQDNPDISNRTITILTNVDVAYNELSRQRILLNNLKCYNTPCVTVNFRDNKCLDNTEELE